MVSVVWINYNKFIKCAIKKIDNGVPMIYFLKVVLKIYHFTFQVL